MGETRQWKRLACTRQLDNGDDWNSGLESTEVNLDNGDELTACGRRRLDGGRQIRLRRSTINVIVCHGRYVDTTRRCGTVLSHERLVGTWRTVGADRAAGVLRRRCSGMCRQIGGL